MGLKDYELSMKTSDIEADLRKIQDICMESYHLGKGCNSSAEGLRCFGQKLYAGLKTPWGIRIW